MVSNVSRDPNSPLTESEKKFLELYLGGKSILAAYCESRKNGPPKNPNSRHIKNRSQEVRHIPRVAKMIDAARKALAVKTEDMLIEKYGVTKEKIVEELAKIAFSDYTDVHTWNEEDGIRAKNSDQIDPSVKGAIVEVNETKGKDGKSKIKIKMADKRAALESLAKIMGAFAPEKHDHRHIVNFIIEK